MRNNLMTMKYYRVVAMCGHVGRGHYLAVSFAVKAPDAHIAAERARLFPRVKHNKNDAIISCAEITLAEYKTIREHNQRDPFFKCHNKQEESAIIGLRDSVLPYLDKKKEK